MKHRSMKSLTMALIFCGAVSLEACKNKKTEPVDSNVTNVNVDSNAANTPSPAPVDISPDAGLERGVQDAIKDYPGVQATVSGGVITLTGSIERAKWQNLKPALDALSPKKVDSKALTIK